MVLIKRVINKYFKEYDQSMQYILSLKVLKTILCNEIINKINELVI